MSRAVTQAQYIAHQQAIIKKSREHILREFKNLGFYQMKELKDAVSYRLKLVGFARSGQMKEFFI